MKLMKIFGLVLILFLAINTTHAEEGTVVWEKTIGPYYSLINWIAPIGPLYLEVDSTGIYIIGQTPASVPELEKIDLDGNSIWKITDFVTGWNIVDMDIDDTGIYISTYKSSLDVVLSITTYTSKFFKLDKTNGNILWSREISNVYNSKLALYNNNLYFGGYGHSETNPKWHFGKINGANGVVSWEKIEDKVNSLYADQIQDIIVDSTGIYLGGYELDHIVVSGEYTLPYNKARFEKRNLNGGFLWSKIGTCCTSGLFNLNLHAGELYSYQVLYAEGDVYPYNTYKYSINKNTGAFTKLNLGSSYGYIAPKMKILENYNYFITLGSPNLNSEGVGRMTKLDPITNVPIEGIKGAYPGLFDIQDGYLYVAGPITNTSWKLEKRQTGHLTTISNQDKGLRVKAGSKTYDVGIENTLSSPLRISKGSGQIYGLELTEVTDPSATPIRVMTSSGIKALKEAGSGGVTNDPCIFNKWYPGTGSVTNGVAFTQYDNCGNTQAATGTLPILEIAITCPTLNLIKKDGTKLYQNNIMKGNVLKGLKSTRYDYFRNNIELGDIISIEENTEFDESYLNSLKLVGYNTQKEKVLVDQNFNPIGYDNNDLIKIENNHYKDKYYEYDHIKLPDVNGHYLYLNGGVTLDWVHKLRNNVLKKLAHPKLYSTIDSMMDVNKEIAFYGDIKILVKKYGLYWERYDIGEIFALENDESGLIKLPVGTSEVKVRYIDNVYDFNEIALLSKYDVDTKVTKKEFNINLDKEVIIDGNNPLQIKVSDILTQEDLDNYNHFYIETDGYYLYGVKMMRDMEVELKDEIKVINHLKDIYVWMQDTEKHIDEMIDFLNN